MRQQVHRNPLSAWNHLCDFGGIELEHRDEGLDQRILHELNSPATSLPDALVEATMDEFVRAFFAAIHPFIAMFQDILGFFERAQAAEGQGQWILRVDDVDLNLEHFRSWITKWSTAIPIRLRCLDHQGQWALLDELRKRTQIERELERTRANQIPLVAHDVVEWFTAYQRGKYVRLPTSLTPLHCPQPLESSALIARAVLERIQGVSPSRDELLAHIPQARNESYGNDTGDFWHLLHSETDHWLRSFIVALSAASTYLADRELVDLGRNLDDIIVQYPLRLSGSATGIDELESVLSLPIWKKRHELYAVWVAAEMLQSLADYNVEINHDNGRMEFGFRESLVASFTSSLGRFDLVTERKTPAKSLIGEGRKQHVQPDYGLWLVEDGKDCCRLIVEVKHYKSPHRQRFLHVFEDYSRAFPLGQVYLVNYGSTGSALDDVSGDVRHRCHAINRLAPSEHSSRRRLAAAIRQAVGSPLALPAKPQLYETTDTVLLLDVSPSMRQYIQSPPLKSFVQNLVRLMKPAELAAAGTAVIGLWPATPEGCASLLEAAGYDTELSAPVQSLLKKFQDVLVISDADGIETLTGVQKYTHDSQTLAPPGVFVYICVPLP